jgi:hypothetical protein
MDKMVQRKSGTANAWLRTLNKTSVRRFYNDLDFT